MTASPSLDELHHEYGSKATAVEPGGAEPIPLDDRHGKPSQMFWTWVSPNMEFATIFVGVIAVLFFGLTFWQAVAAIVSATRSARISHGVLTSWGPERGLAQMVLSRRPFGYRGNLLPAGINAIVAGVGWFAVNAISGALALSALTGWNGYLCLVIGVVLMLAVAFLGYNFVHLFERFAFPVLVVIFLAGMAVILPATQTGPVGDAVPGGFWIALGASFGYTAGWNPYAADYSRYLPPAAAKRSGIYAGIGNFLSSTVLQIAGAAAVTAVGVANWNGANPTGSYISLMPGWLGGITLLAIFIGAISANALNLYSAAMSFAALGLHLPTAFARAVIALVVGLAGLVVAIFTLTTSRSTRASCCSSPTGSGRGWAWCSPTACSTRPRRATSRRSPAPGTSTWPARSPWRSRWSCRSRCSATSSSTSACWPRRSRRSGTSRSRSASCSRSALYAALRPALTRRTAAATA